MKTIVKAICLFDLKDCENTLVAKAGEVVEIENYGNYVSVKKQYAFSDGVVLTKKEASLLLKEIN